MAKGFSARVPQRVRYRGRIAKILADPPSKLTDGLSTAIDAHWAKYACVLVSGYLEQSIREIMIDFCTGKAAPSIARYIDRSWPKSANMRPEFILKIMEDFSEDWHLHVTGWLDQDSGSRRSTIKSIVTLRNNIAHGNESNTTGVTMVAVTEQFRVACSLVDELELLVLKT